jgi:dihydrofolate reductase
MRSVVAYELLSLDGVAEHPDQFFTEFDEAMRENLGRVIATQDAVLLGRRTYDDWAAYWPRSDIQPFSSFINPVQKFVVTSAPLEDEWINTTVVEGDLATFVGELKGQSGGDIGVHGSIALTQALLRADLIDELRLVVAPALQANGRRLFDGAEPGRLVTTRCVTSPAGYVLLDYRRPHAA